MEREEDHGTGNRASETHSRAAVLALIYRVPGPRDPWQSTDSKVDTSSFCAATHLSASPQPVTQAYGSALNLAHSSPPKGAIFAGPCRTRPYILEDRSCAAPRSLPPAPSSTQAGKTAPVCRPRRLTTPAHDPRNLSGGHPVPVRDPDVR